MQCSEASVKDSKLLISSERLLNFLTLSTLKFRSKSISLYAELTFVFDVICYSLQHGLNVLQGIQNESKSVKKSLKVKVDICSLVLPKSFAIFQPLGNETFSPNVIFPLNRV